MAKCILVTSGKGGVGKSTFTTGIAKALAEREHRVLAIDCDVGLRSLDILLDRSAETVFDWGDVLLGNCDEEKAVIKGDVDFIAAPKNFNDSFKEDNFSKMVDYYSKKYDYIFIDSPAGIDRGFRVAASGADSAVVITTPDSVCVRSCFRAFSELEGCGIKNVRLIVNMFEAKSTSKGNLLNIDECIDKTGVQLIGVVPMDQKLKFYSVTGDEPGEFSPSSLAFDRIARRFDGERVRLVCS